MFEQAFKNIDDTLWKDSGVSNELDYVEQTSWILFLKYLDDLEKDKETEAKLAGQKYEYIIKPNYRWETWATPKTSEGKIDHNKALTGDDLKDFVDRDLFPYLKRFRTETDNPDTIEYKIGEIFSEVSNKIQSGYTLRNILDIVDGLRFRSQKEKHELSHLYEAKIKNMGNAGRNGGEYYTPRPLIKTIVKVVDPKIGETIYDAAVGSAGFLVEAFEYLKESKKLSTKDIETLQKKTLYGKEKKSLAYIIGVMNLILHGVEAPNIIHKNSLSENLSDVQEKDQYDIVLANPPFGGKERSEVQQNFPIKTGETAFLFLQHFIKHMRAGGRAGIVIKNTFLSNNDNAAILLRKLVLENCNLHTILDLPGGTFTGAGVRTVVLFFEKGSPTTKIWYYQLNPGRNLGKTNPLNEKDLVNFIELQKDFVESENSWALQASDLNKDTYDLSVRNPNNRDDVTVPDPEVLIDEILSISKNNMDILKQIRLKPIKVDWPTENLGDVCNIIGGGTPAKSNSSYYEGDIPWATVRDMKGDVIRETDFKITKQAVKQSSTNIIPKGNIVIATRVGLGKVSFLENDTAINQDLKGIVPKDKNKLSPDFIFWWFKSIENEILKTGTGATVQGVKVDFIKNLQMPIPPMSEQNKITKSLKEAFERYESIHENELKNIKNLSDLRKSTILRALNK